ncbi:MAG: acetyltransferase [Lachnospiraceae bacterium]|nr:acetyltransferase [Lachnospiraceae bacterium]
MEKIILLGSGGHAKSVVDVIERAGKYEIAGFLEVPEKQSFSYKKYKVIGVDEDLEMLYRSGIKYAFITMGYIGKSTPRQKLYEKLKKTGYQIPVIIDPSAIIAKDAEISEGTFVGKYSIINSDSKVGKMCIINSGAIVEHECIIEEYTHIAVGTVLSGNVKVGKYTFVGANATIIQGILVGDNVVIGAGSVVLNQLEDGVTAVGTPARVIKCK